MRTEDEVERLGESGSGIMAGEPAGAVMGPEYEGELPGQMHGIVIGASTALLSIAVLTPGFLTGAVVHEPYGRSVILRERPHLVTMDLQMPVGSGLDAIDHQTRSPLCGGSGGSSRIDLQPDGGGEGAAEPTPAHALQRDLQPPG